MLGVDEAREVPRHGPVVGEQAGGRARPANAHSFKGELTSGGFVSPANRTRRAAATKSEPSPAQAASSAGSAVWTAARRSFRSLPKSVKVRDSEAGRERS
jgi:hypothetical protein